MGNNVGIQIHHGIFRIVYAESDPNYILFIQQLQSQYLVNTLSLLDLSIFMFQCTLQQLLAYDSSKNIELLRQNYKEMLSQQKLIIKANRQTINMIQASNLIKDALSSILMRNYEFVHKERSQIVFSVLDILKHRKIDAFYSLEAFPILELGNFQENNKINKIREIDMPEEYLLASIRQGISFFKVRDSTIQKVHGSIIGEKTLLGIMNFKFPNTKLNDLIKLAFSEGSLHNTDLLVSDIYGPQTGSLGLPSKLLASSMGKIGKMPQNQIDNLSAADLARSIITSFCINIGIHISLQLSKQKIKGVLILGDELHNEATYWIIQSVVKHFQKDARVNFCDFAPFIGCIGVALHQ